MRTATMKATTRRVLLANERRATQHVSRAHNCQEKNKRKKYIIGSNILETLAVLFLNIPGK
jgi:hypothetical protein